MVRSFIVILLIIVSVFCCILFLITPDISRATLEAKYHVSPRDYLDVKGIRLHLLDKGPKASRTLILLHGFGSSLQTWDAWTESLSKDYRVIRFDLPGAGLTGPDPTGDYSDDRSIQILVALMEKLGVPRATLIGNSIGGRIAWKFAALYPERVDKLILVSPDGFASPGFEYSKRPDVPSVLRLIPYVLPKWMVRMNLLPAYGNPATLNDALVARYYDMLRAPGVRNAMIKRMEQTVLENPESFLRRIQAPTLILWGEKDRMIPYGNSADYKRGIPHSALVRLPGIGHVPQEEEPALSLAPIRKFLAPW